MKFFGIIGWKNSGKTGLVERLVAEIVRRGHSVSTIKHAHHSFDVDHEGRDSYRHRQAGATQVLLSSRKRWALMTENRDGRAEAPYAELTRRLEKVDLVLVEGFKSEDIPKVEAHRGATGQPLLALKDPRVLAVASDTAELPCNAPVFHLDDTSAIADFILAKVGLAPFAKAKPQGLAQDCFALPPGVDWVPVDDALAHLRARLAPVTGAETLAIADASGRILAQAAHARRAAPPLANTAVDGYGFTQGNIAAGSTQSFDLVVGQSAPGAPFAGQVGAGQAVRVLTGGPLPDGVDTVALQEHVQVDGGKLWVKGPLKAGENTRKAGEDLMPGDVILPAGRRLMPQDLALLTSGGLSHVEVRQKLRVGILSTGNELTDAGNDAAGPAHIFDANRPMLTALARAWGHEPVDLGICADERALLVEMLGNAAANVDVLLTSGGASAGDADYVADVVAELGTLHNWRIAIKPGRPLAMGQIGQMPVFGLPGNPVAAFVCAVLFARPALSVLAGAGWPKPAAFWVPAGFTKSKKAGRREYLRARMGDDGRVERFHSEGSGRISGLSWADGLVELPDEAMKVAPGDLVRFLPYAGFGLGES